MRSYIASSVGARRRRAPSRRPREQPLELARVRAELVVALLDRLEQRDDRLGDVRLELRRSPGRRSASSIASGGSPVATDMISIRFATPGLSAARAHLAAGVGDGDLELLADHVRRVGHRAPSPSPSPPVVDILFVRLLQVHDPRADLGVLAVGKPERLAEALVEARRRCPA